MNRMRFLVVAGIVAGGAFVSVGCRSSARTNHVANDYQGRVERGETFGETPSEHYQRVSRYTANEKRSLAEDIDLLLLRDRGSRLSRWHDK